jgi:NAD-dependent deacetylase
MARLERGEMIEPPPCPHCGAALRPDVVWFEEPLPQGEWMLAHAAAQNCDVCLVAGTSAQVMPAALLPYTARQVGAYLIEVNPEATDMSSDADWVAQAPAGVVLPALVRAVWPESDA